jgi:CRISPR-associated protein Csm1
VNYSGGDDLFIVGAWNQLVDLACRVREDFKTFTCHNPDITISGGIFLCNGKFPIHQAAQHTKYLLENLAKNNETMEAGLDGKITQRNALAIFNHRVPWGDFLELRAIGNDLIHAIHTGKVHRTFLYKLLDLHTTWKTYRKVNTARLYYLMIRNIKETAYRKTLIEKLGSHKYLSHTAYLPMIVGYTGLKVRRSDRDLG